MSKRLSALFGMIGILAAGAAEARTEALLIAAKGDAAARQALIGLQADLLGKHRYETVTLGSAGTPAELAETLRSFLGRPGSPDDLRVLWVVAPGRGAKDSLCPAMRETAVAPKVPSLVLGPACLKWVLRLEPGFHHFDDLTSVLGGQNEAPPEGGPVPFAFLNLPEDAGAAERRIKGLLPDDGPVSPLSLFNRLSCGTDGEYRPALDAYPNHAAWSLNLDGEGSRLRSAFDPEGLKCPQASATQPEKAAAKAEPPAAAEPAAVAPQPAVTPPPLPAAGTPLSFAAPVNGKVVGTFGQKGTGIASNGIDIAAPQGAPVVAAEAGEVVFVGKMPRHGNVLAIKHADDWATVYTNTDKISVERGMRVSRGQEVAKVGIPEGQSEGQLHFELRHKGKPVDPQVKIASSQ